MSEFLRACRREATAFTPIWLMRQAGRYQPEYRALREKFGFVEMCKNAEVAAEVTLLPVTQLNVDAAIIFADILLILEPLGIGFRFTPDDGPRIDKPIRDAAAVDGVAAQIDPEESLGYVLQAIKNTRSGLPARVPLIGFCGAPFTLASYVIEGGGSRDYMHTKALMFSDPGAFSALMQKLTSALVLYLNAQVKAGAQALQVFDSWVGCLSPSDYQTYVQPHMKRLFRELDRSVPVIHFGTGNPALYPLMKAAGGDVIGIDFRCELGATWDVLGDTAVMGNLDPYSLLAPRAELERRAGHVLAGARERAGHIFNLGHGIFPEASVDQVRALVDYVHQASAR
ncbi:MAG TPA: uroporphyrinogen decarboxylase [Polyangiales bacterium]|nr:uroporphyrinogen decarboxylase [Polyangiales bacterium]